MTFSVRVAAWEASGEYVEIGQRKIFVRNEDGAGTPILLLHGYPSSSFDWSSVLPLLAGRRVLAFDFLGFGLSAKPRDVHYSLMTQADLVESAGERFTDGRVTLVAHDMGTSVTTELLARDIDDQLSFDIEKVLLFNGSMVVEKAQLTRGQKVLRSRLGPLLARLSSSTTFRQEFRRLFSPDHPLTQAEAADQWSLIAYNGGNKILDRLITYIGERTLYAPRWHGALRDWPGDLRLAWGLLDPVAVVEVLDAVLALRPHAPVTRWPDLGHYPQLEDPARVAAVISAL